jgi:hypothetical protein
MSMFENMVICVEILLSLDISMKCAQCVKIWLFMKCVQFTEVLCSVSNGHYIEFGNYSISDEEKGRCALGTRVSHLIKWRRVRFARISHMEKGRHALTRHVLHMGKGRHTITMHVSLLPSPHCAS